MLADGPTTYDEVPYESHPFALTHPDWLATIGALFRMNPPGVDRCRVLELGCASGGNIVPMAAALPGSTFIGLDLSSREIGEGNAVVAQAGLTNIELRHASILDVDETYGLFDYIICYGVFSWVPRAVQDKILSICDRNLTANGIAYVNYNAQPGGHMMSMLRDMMLFNSRRSEEPAGQIRHARALLELLAKWIPDHASHRSFLKDAAEKMRTFPDAFIFHEFLEQVNERFYFLDFMDRAEARGLQFLGEAQLATMFLHQHAPEEVQTALAEVAPTLKLREQYVDFFRNTTFRQTLLCHKGIPLSHQLDAKRVMSFCFGGQLAPTASVEVRTDAPATFQGRWGAVTTSWPVVKAALLCLNDASPRVVPFGELMAMARARAKDATSPDRAAIVLADTMWYLVTHQLIDMKLTGDRFRVDPTERPRASAVARAQAKAGSDVTNLRHFRVSIDGLSRRVLAELDGTTDRRTLVERVRGTSPDDGSLETKVEAALRAIGAWALLLA